MKTKTHTIYITAAKKYATMYDENGDYQAKPRIVIATSKRDAAKKLKVLLSQVYEY